MTTTRNPGRTAGFLYLLSSIPGFFALLYVPSKIFVRGNPSATAQNRAVHELPFRSGIFASLIGQASFVVVALALCQLLRGIDRRYALLMVILITIPVPIAFVNELNAVAALMLARGAGLLSAVQGRQRIAWMRFFLDLRGAGYDLAGIFWGLWLFPLGLLVYRSGFTPKLLGVLLMIGCFAYLANSATSLLFPVYADAVARWMNPIQLVEMVFMPWLLIWGAVPTHKKGLGGPLCIPSRDFRNLGICPGDIVMLHASVRAVGEVAGGPDSIHLALKSVLSDSGTLLMYASCPRYYDESGRGTLAAAEEAELRNTLPAFDPLTARADRDNGTLVDLLRTY